MFRSRHKEFLRMVPEDWDQARIDEIGVVLAGGTPSRGQPSFWNGDVPWVTPGEITQLDGKLLLETTERITRRGVAGSAATMLPVGTLLVTTRATIGALAIAGVPLTTNQGFKNIVPGPASDSTFFYYLLQRVAPEMRRLASGSTFDEISKREFAAIRVPRPPVPEQRRIAEVLDTADEAIRQTEALIAKMKQMKQGLLHDLLTRGLDENGELRDPVAHPEQFKDSPLGRIPRRWEVAELASRRRDGVPHLKTGPFGSSLKGEHWVEDGIPVITIGALGEGVFYQSELLHVSERTAATLEAYVLQVGDIVFSRVADVGRSVVVTETEAGWIMSSNLMRISLDKALANPFFVRAAIARAEYVKQQIRRFINAGGREVANTGILNSIRFAWPSLGEQSRIVGAVDAHDARIRAEEAYRDKLQLLTKGLMQDLLTGRVRVPVPENEPQLVEVGA
jgi:type I restriction enzyme, S subunit